MDANAEGSCFAGAIAAPGLDLLSDSREAMETNFAVTVEGSRAVWNGLRAVGEELSTFLAARIRNHGAFAESLLTCLVPGAALVHATSYLTAEIKAWDEEQSRLLGLFVGALTETMLGGDTHPPTSR